MKRRRFLSKTTAGALLVSVLGLVGPTAGADSHQTTVEGPSSEEPRQSPSVPVLDPVLDLVDAITGVPFSSSVSAPVPSAPDLTGAVVDSGARRSAVPAVRSVTVLQSAESYGSCTDRLGQVTAGLSFPNGVCRLSVTVVNGGAAGHIQVRGGLATAHDQAPHWVLCGGSGGPPCTGPGGLPGLDEYQQWTSGPGGRGPMLSLTPQCDTAFSAQCRTLPAQTSTETLFLRGPESSSAGVAPYTTTLLWTAVP